MFLSVFGALVIMMSRLKVSFFRYRSEHAAEKITITGAHQALYIVGHYCAVVGKNNRPNPVLCLRFITFLNVIIMNFHKNWRGPTTSNVLSKKITHQLAMVTFLSTKRKCYFCLLCLLLV